MDLEQTQQKVVELKNQAVEALSNTVHQAQETASSVAEQVQAKVDEARQAVADTVADNAYAQQILSAADSTGKSIQATIDSTKQAVADSSYGQQILSAAESAKQSAQSAVDTAKNFVATEVAAAAGYKDQLVGAAKEKIGNLTGDATLASAGTQQQREGASAVATAGVPADQLAREDREQVTDTLIKRHALVAEVERTGGAGGADLKHVDGAPTGDADVAALAKDLGTLKTFNKEPLLSSIQQGADLKHVETQEKGLLVSVPLNDVDLSKSVGASALSPRNAVLDALKQPASLSTVAADDKADRSEPRLDGLKSIGQATASRGDVVREIGAGEPALKPTTTDDKSGPQLDLPSLNQKPVDKAQLLAEVQQGTDLKAVEKS